MTISCRGPFVRIYINANEATTKTVNITLPNGYSFETIRILFSYNISALSQAFNITDNTRYTFPPINSHSPCTLLLSLKDISSATDFKFLIEKFGQIPDPKYFDKVFDPILVTGDDGNKYNVIPSDQFK